MASTAILKSSRLAKCRNNFHPLGDDYTLAITVYDPSSNSRKVRGKEDEDSPRVHCAGLDTKKLFVILFLIVETQRACFLLLSLFSAFYNRTNTIIVDVGDILFSDQQNCGVFILQVLLIISNEIRC